MPSIELRSLFIAAIFLILSGFILAHAQDDTSDEDARVLDSVVVTGVQNDEAMAAFRAGEYADAEVGFLGNARCAHRRERNLSAAIDSARSSSFRSDINPVQPNGASNAPGNIAQPVKRTCAHRGFQVYMAGLSQIQLGKPEEARQNFKKATALSKILYDAHYKLALMALLDGDQKTAERQLKKISGILKRCRRCPARQEILDRQAHLQKALSGEVKLY
ncbi:MAG: hypothetical protein AAFN91_02580 [Pseudomonadota bacterium]